MDNFKEKYSNYSNSALLKIVSNPDDYQPLAVETASVMLSERHLSDEEMEIAKEELLNQEERKEVHHQRILGYEIRLKEIVQSIIDIFRPTQNTTSADRIIKIMSILFACSFLYSVFKYYDLLKFALIDGNIDFFSVLILASLIFLCVATVLFYKQRKMGWTLLGFNLTVSILFLIISIYQNFVIRANYADFGNVYPSDTLEKDILGSIFLIGCLWAICKANIRDVYHVSTKYALKVIGVATLLIVCVVYGILS